MGKPTFLYDDFATAATFTATDTLAGTDIDDVAIPTEDTFWSPANATGTKAITIDQGSAKVVDYFALLGGNMDAITVEVRGSTDNFAVSDVQLSAGATLSAPINAGWRKFTNLDAYRYIKLNISSHPSDLRIGHIGIGSHVELPYFEKDWDAESSRPEGVQLVSSAGFFIGSNQRRNLKQMPLDFGQVVDADFTKIKAWKVACIDDIRPFFMVPDADEDDCFFGWLQGGGSFSAPRNLGIYDVKPFTFRTRAA